MAETTFLQEEAVQVTSTRFQCADSMYPLNGITAVSLVQLPKTYGLALVALLLGMGGVGIGINAEIGFLLVVGLILLFASAVLAFIEKRRWAIVIATAGGQVRAIDSSDKAFLERIAGALNEAIAERG